MAEKQIKILRAKDLDPLVRQTFKLPKSLRDRLQSMAVGEDRTASALVLRAVKEYVNGRGYGGRTS